MSTIYQSNSIFMSFSNKYSIYICSLFSIYNHKQLENKQKLYNKLDRKDENKITFAH